MASSAPATDGTSCVRGYTYIPGECESFFQHSSSPFAADVHCRLVCTSECSSQPGLSAPVLRSRFWNERFGLVDTEDVLLVVAPPDDPSCQKDEHQDSPTTMTLRAFLNERFPVEMTEDLEDAHTKVLFQVRYQAVFLPPTPANGETCTMTPREAAAGGSGSLEDHPSAFLLAKGTGTYLMPSSHGFSTAFGIPRCSGDTNGLAKADPKAVRVFGPSTLREVLSLSESTPDFIVPEGFAMLIQLPMRTSVPPKATGDAEQKANAQLAASKDQPPTVVSATLLETLSDNSDASSSSWDEITEITTTDKLKDAPGPCESVSALSAEQGDGRTEEKSATEGEAQVRKPPTEEVALDLRSFQGIITVSLFFRTSSLLGCGPNRVLLEPIVALLDNLYSGKSGLPSQSPSPKTDAPPGHPSTRADKSDLGGVDSRPLRCAQGHCLTPVISDRLLSESRTCCAHCTSSFVWPSSVFACRQCNLWLCTACHASALEEVAKLRSRFHSAGADGIVLTPKCPRNHSLTRLSAWWGMSTPFPTHRFSCDVCRHYITQGEKGFCCRACDYDICGKCHKNSTVSLRTDLFSSSAVRDDPQAEEPASTATGVPSIIVNCGITCPAKHGLIMYDTTAAGHTNRGSFCTCDVCGIAFVGASAGGYYCRKCDYDVCKSCYAKVA